MYDVACVRGTYDVACVRGMYNVQVLERAPTHDHEGLSLALQLALGRKDLTMVEVLINLAASPRYVELECTLFAISRTHACPWTCAPSSFFPISSL